MDVSVWVCGCGCGGMCGIGCAFVFLIYDIECWKFESTVVQHSISEADAESLPVDVTPRPVDCLDVKELGYSTSGRYNIYPSSKGVSDEPVEVWCDMESTEGSWTVRINFIYNRYFCNVCI